MAPIRCEVAFGCNSFCERKTHRPSPLTLRISFSSEAHADVHTYVCVYLSVHARARTRKRLAVLSHRCCLSDGMINEARPRTHSSGTREALAITGGISHTVTPAQPPSATLE